MFENTMPALTENEFKATFSEPMTDITSAPSNVIDIWPYIKSVSQEIGLPKLVLEKELVELVYRGGNGVYDHVLLPTEKKNKFVIVVVDRPKATITGHHILDLNREYGT